MAVNEIGYRRQPKNITAGKKAQRSDAKPQLLKLYRPDFYGDKAQSRKGEYNAHSTA